jgi:hypothetical protein
MPQKKALINTKEIDKKRDILKSKLSEAKNYISDLSKTFDKLDMHYRAV